MVPKRFLKPISRRPGIERLETRLNLSGDGVADAHESGSCVFEARSDDEAARAVQAVNCFAADLYQHFEREEGNLFLSPLSITTALAMTFAGAKGETAAEMRDVLHLGEEPGIHESFGALLASLGNEHRGVELELANAMWPQEGFTIHDSFVEQIAANYRGTAQSVDYVDPEAREQARETINGWVEDRTQGKVRELIEEGVFNHLTRLVLTNAIHFQGPWLKPFGPRSAKMRPFVRDDGTTIEVPTLTSVGTDFFNYTEQDGFQVLELPLAMPVDPFEPLAEPPDPAKASMVLLLPKEGKTTDDLTPETLAKVDAWFDEPHRSSAVDVYLPRFQTTVATDLKPLLADLGMRQMFDPALSDFSGITDNPSFHITHTLHKAAISVDEHGVEAAAATAVVGGIICFAKGTPIQTPAGDKPIEELEPGDHVLSRDEHAVEGAIEPKRVEKTFKNEKEIVHLQVNGQLIRTTSEHPFFVRDRGWTAASELRGGDLLAADLRSWVEVEQIVATGQTETVYNIQVADHHTYFVGSQSWGFAVWAHNRCGAPPDFIFDANRPFHFFIRDNTNAALLMMGRIDDPTQTENSITPRTETDKTNPDPSPLPGDADGDDDVDFADFLVLSQNFGKTEDVVFAEGDFNVDGVINFADFLILQENYGKTRPLIGEDTMLDE